MSGETSNDIGVVRLVKAYEPRLDIRADREFVATIGPSNISTRRFRADSISTAQTSWSLTTPSVRIGVDRTIEVDMIYRITFAPQVAGQPVVQLIPNLFNVGNVGPRAYPIHSTCEVVSLTLNDQHVSLDPSDIIHPLLEYGNDIKERQYNMGATPHRPDVFWRYDQPAGPRAPFASWFACGTEDSRRLGFWATRINDTTFDLRCVEQLMISPLVWGDEVQCLFGIQNIDLNLIFKQPLTRILSGDLYNTLFDNGGGVPITFAAGDRANPTVTIVDANLHVTYLQPQAHQIIPARLNYPYYNIKKLSQDIPVDILPNTQFPQDVVYNNITLHEIPKRVYVFALPVLPNVAEAGIWSTPPVAANLDAIKYTDCYAAIDSLTVNFDTQDGRLSTLDSYDLWKISCKNGLKRSFLEWQQFIGSVLCLEFGTDLNLNPLLAPGVRGNYQLSLTVRYKDIRNFNASGNLQDLRTNLEPKRYRAYLIVVTAGIMTIENQLITISIGSITEQQIYAAPWAEAGLRQEIKDMYGGGSYKNVFKALSKSAKAAMPAISGISGVLGDVLAGQPGTMGNIGKAAKVVSALSRGRGGRRMGGAQVSSHSLSRRM